jgi:hypothetical protein
MFCLRLRQYTIKRMSLYLLGLMINSYLDYYNIKSYTGSLSTSASDGASDRCMNDK